MYVLLQRSPTNSVCGKAWSALNSVHGPSGLCNTPIDLLLRQLCNLFNDVPKVIQTFPPLDQTLDKVQLRQSARAGSSPLYKQAGAPACLTRLNVMWCSRGAWWWLRAMSCSSCPPQWRWTGQACVASRVWRPWLHWHWCGSLTPTLDVILMISISHDSRKVIICILKRRLVSLCLCRVRTTACM
jgi:hypothetical protein